MRGITDFFTTDGADGTDSEEARSLSNMRENDSENENENDFWWREGRAGTGWSRKGYRMRKNGRI